jgi:hypothetical protein
MRRRVSKAKSLNEVDAERERERERSLLTIKK